MRPRSTLSARYIACQPDGTLNPQRYSVQLAVRFVSSRLGPLYAWPVLEPPLASGPCGEDESRSTIKRKDEPSHGASVRSKPALKEAEGAHDLRYASDTGGLETPRDIALAGFHNEPWTELVGTGLTVIKRPVADIGRCPEDELAECLPERSSGWLFLAPAGRRSGRAHKRGFVARTNPLKDFPSTCFASASMSRPRPARKRARILDLVDAGRLDADRLEAAGGELFAIVALVEGASNAADPGRHVLSAKRADTFETFQKGDAGRNQIAIAPRARNYSPFVQPD